MSRREQEPEITRYLCLRCGQRLRWRGRRWACGCRARESIHHESMSPEDGRLDTGTLPHSQTQMPSRQTLPAGHS